MGVGSGDTAEHLPSIMKFKNECISTKSKTFCPHEKCQMHVNIRDVHG